MHWYIPRGADGIQGEQGPQGIQGIQGPKGDDGYTPVKGTDYFTQADIADFSQNFENVNNKVNKIGDYTQGYPSVTGLKDCVECVFISWINPTSYSYDYVMSNSEYEYYITNFIEIGVTNIFQGSYDYKSKALQIGIQSNSILSTNPLRVTFRPLETAEDYDEGKCCWKYISPLIVTDKATGYVFFQHYWDNTEQKMIGKISFRFFPNNTLDLTHIDNFPVNKKYVDDTISSYELLSNFYDKFSHAIPHLVQHYTHQIKL